MNPVSKAYDLLREWKQESYLFGMGVLGQLGTEALRYGKRFMVVSSAIFQEQVEQLMDALRANGAEIVCGVVPDAKPNAPREDVYRLESYILHHRPDCVIALGGGSTLDACKAAIALAAYGAGVTPEIDHYLGTGLISAAKERTGKDMIPLIAVQVSASSGAHLTKYSNITDPVAGQKLLIVDPAIVPKLAVFDYRMTLTMPMSVSVDGALDAIAHTFEVFCGAKPEIYDKARELMEIALELVVTNTPRLLKNPRDEQAREALGLATDLGGYAIMIGGTSGAHLTSFSLVDLVPHGTACGIMNPYYAVFYSPAIQDQLACMGKILKKHGYIQEDVESLHGRDRAMAVAAGMVAFGKAIHAPTTLGELNGFSEEHVQRILAAAKNPQLSMKLQNMPIPMTSDDVDPYMEPLIRAAVDGNMARIKNK